MNQIASLGLSHVVIRSPEGQGNDGDNMFCRGRVESGLHRSYRSYFDSSSSATAAPAGEERDEYLSDALFHPKQQQMHLLSSSTPPSLQKRRSEPIDMRLTRSDSERQLAENEQAAEHRDYCMYVRIVNGMTRRKDQGNDHKDPTSWSLNTPVMDPSLINIVRSRQGQPRHREQQQPLQQQREMQPQDSHSDQEFFCYEEDPCHHPQERQKKSYIPSSPSPIPAVFSSTPKNKSLHLDNYSEEESKISSQDEDDDMFVLDM